MSVFRRLRWIYKKLRLRRLRYALPFLVLVVYTIFGAYVFRHFELEPDELRRAKYSASTEYAFNQVNFNFFVISKRKKHYNLFCNILLNKQLLKT